MTSLETMRKYVAEGIPEFDVAYTLAGAERFMLRHLLYEAIKELAYVQCVAQYVEAGDHSLCATSAGREIVDRGMSLLGVADLSAERLEVGQ